MDSLTEQSLPLILSQLDPHSVYLSVEENKESTESLEGSFAGIGVQFNTLLDTVVVVRVVEGGPSERAGLQPGDRLLRADTTNLVRDSITSEQIMKALKGPEDTVVKLTVRRGGKTFTTSVVRGAVPVPTIDASYMIRPHVLYVRLNKWGTQTPLEFQQPMPSMPPKASSASHRPPRQWRGLSAGRYGTRHGVPLQGRPPRLQQGCALSP